MTMREAEWTARSGRPVNRPDRCGSFATRRLITFSRLEPKALDVGILDGLKLDPIADWMQLARADVGALLDEALGALRRGPPSSTEQALSRWREALRDLERLPPGDEAHVRLGLKVAYGWLDFQVASGAVPLNEVIIIAGADRRCIATSGNAAELLGRPSLIGLRIDDITVDDGRPMLPEAWNRFVATGSMTGEFACDRPGQAPIRLRYRAYPGRPLPGMQVSYLRPLAST